MSAYFFYIIYIALFAILALIPRRLQRIELMLVLLLMLIILGGSAQNGADWIWYHKYYVAMSESPSFEVARQVSTFEVGFIALMYICAKAGLPFQYLVFLCAVICSVSWLYFIRNIASAVRVSLATLFLFLIDGWTLYNEQLRQAVAISIALVAFVQWQKKKIKVSFLLLTLSLLFHRSTIAMFLLFFLTQYLNQHKKKWVSMTLITQIYFGVAFIVLGSVFVVNSGVLSIFAGNTIVDKLIAYNMDENYGNSVFSLGMIGYLLGLIVLILSYNLVKTVDNRQLQMLWFVMLLWCIIGPILRTQAIFVRFEHYFIIFIPVLLGYLWKLKQPIGNKLVLQGFILIFALSFTFRVFLQPSQSVWVAKYQNIFLNSLVGLQSEDLELRKFNICENLKENDNSFCEWESTQ